MTSDVPALPDDPTTAQDPAGAADEPTAAGAGVPGSGAAPPAAAGDPFPRERFVGLVARLPRYLRLAWGLAGEPRLSRKGRAGVLAAAAYLASPIDAIPGVIPIVGQVDDVAVALLALRAALRALDPATRERHLLAVGLAPDALDRDLGTLAVTAAWLARRGVAIGRQLGRLALTASVAAGRAGAGMVRRGLPVAVRTTAAVARRGAPAVADIGSRAARAGAGAGAAGAGAARTGARVRAGAVALAGAAGRGLGGLRARSLPAGPPGGATDEAPGEASRDAGSGI